jgi:hypothetical protein
VADSTGSARKGRATEQLIAAMCVLASGGELNALTALVDDEGVDLGLKRRNGTRTLDLQVKSGFVDERRNLRDRGIFIADVGRETFRPRDDLYMLYVVVDGSRAEVIRAWLVPSAILEAQGFEVATKGRRLLRFQASAKPTTDDKWRPYRLERSELVSSLVDVVRNLEEPPQPAN